jgi:hypothetical protein
VILLSLVLVLASLGLLVVGLAGASQMLVWASIGVSVAAGTCLAVAALQRRARTAGHPELTEPLDAPTAGESASGRAGVLPEPAAEPATTPPDTAAPVVDELGAPVAEAPPAGAGAPADQPPLGEAERPAEGYRDPPGEPPREDVSAPDALRVVGPGVVVHVVDGRPRYHLADCPHLTDREAVPLPLAEARDAGFTPCALCRPDSTLASRARHAATGATRPGAPGAPATQPPQAEPPVDDPGRR